MDSLLTSDVMGKIADKVGELLRKWNVRETRGATADEIAAFEKKHRRKLTPAAKEFFGAVNGAFLEPGLFRLLSLSDASEWIERWGTEGVGVAWKFAPLGGLDDCDPYCVACGSPLKGMVVRVPHDDEADLMFRSIETWLDWLMTVEIGDDWVDTWDKPHEFSDPKRTTKDFAVATKLQAIEEFESEIEETDNQRFSMVLMSEAGLDLFAKKLKAANYYTRESAEMMLAKMKSPKAAEILREYAAELDAFASRCIDAVRNAEPEIEATYPAPRNRSWLSAISVQLRWRSNEVPMWFGGFYPDDPLNRTRIIDMARFNLKIPTDAISDEAMKMHEDRLHTQSVGDSREIEACLLKMPGKRAVKVLATFRKKVQAFGERCVAYLRKHGVEATLNSSDSEPFRPIVAFSSASKVNELEVRSLYAKREEPDLLKRILERAKRISKFTE